MRDGPVGTRVEDMPGDAQDANAAYAVTVDRLQSAEPGSREAELAFTELYGQHYDFVLGHAGRFANSKIDPQDVAQEVFIGLLDKIQQYSSEHGVFRAWLTTVTRNATFDILRRNKKHIAVSKVSDNGRSTSSVDYRHSVDPEAHLLTKEALLHAMAVGRDENRLIWLSRLAGFGPEEISADTGRSVPAVMGRLNRSRKEAKASLEDSGQAPSVRRAA